MRPGEIKPYLHDSSRLVIKFNSATILRVITADDGVEDSLLWGTGSSWLHSVILVNELSNPGLPLLGSKSLELVFFWVKELNGSVIWINNLRLYMPMRSELPVTR